MSDGSSQSYTAGLEPANIDERPFAALATRVECLKALDTGAAFDLVVCGGGLTAAMTAHQLALEGIRVLVLESGYFGVRGVAMRNIFASTLARQPLDLARGYGAVLKLSRSIAPHLATVVTAEPHEWAGWRGKLGARALKRAWREASGRLPGVKNGFPDLDEVLLTRECILAARQEGAVALSHVQPLYVEAESSSGCYTAAFRDLVTLKEYQAKAGGILVDPTDGFLPPTRLGSPLLKAPEILPTTMHHVFSVEPRTLSAGSRFACFELSDGSLATVSRVSEGVVEVVTVCAWQLLSPETARAVAEDACRQAGWVVRSVVSSWASGRRYSSTRGVTRHGGVLLVQERGPWDAIESCRQVLSFMIGLSKGRTKHKARLLSRILPGVERACELDAFRALARSHGISESTIELVVNRWKGRVRYIEEFEGGFEEIVPGVLAGEVCLAVYSDQVATLDDLCFAALKVHFIPGWQSMVPTLAARLAQELQQPVGGEAVQGCLLGRGAAQ